MPEAFEGLALVFWLDFGFGGWWWGGGWGVGGGLGALGEGGSGDLFVFADELLALGEVGGGLFYLAGVWGGLDLDGNGRGDGFL